ncbi:hypothetical protein VNI00_008145 [Paramarasmius palmivorus]|uniref:Uncharacterized protein n=1 Tax=Paramarasmius palmivorus TaxID=297713 RepID=A0AAW0CZV8_9AGAR
MGSTYPDVASLLSATVSDTTDSTEVAGLGSLSGKVIKRLGQLVLDQVDLIIARRRLVQIEAYFANRNSSPGTTSFHDIEVIFNDLIELSRDVYEHQLRTRAFRIIMSEIGSMNHRNLAASAVKIDSRMEIYLHLSGIMNCLWGKGIGSITETAPPYTIDQDDLALWDQESFYRSEGHKAYVSSFPRHLQVHGTPRFFFYSPLLLYLALVAAYGTQEHCRMIVRLNIVDFLRTLGLSEGVHQVQEALAPRILLYTLMSKLSPDSDTDIYSSVAEYFWELHSSSKRSVQAQRNGLWAWAEHDDQVGPDLLDVEMKTKIADATSIWETVSLNRLTYVNADRINVPLMSQDRQGLSILFSQVLEWTAPLESPANYEHILNEMFSSLLDIPPLCYFVDGIEGVLVRDLKDQVLVPELDFYKRVRLTLETLHEHSYDAMSLRDASSSTTTLRATDQYLLDLLVRAEANPWLISTLSDHSIIQNYCRLKESNNPKTLKETKHTVGDKEYNMYIGHITDRRQSQAPDATPTVVVYITDLSTYDEAGAGSLKASLAEFSSICSQSFSVPIILFMTGLEALEANMKVSAIRDHFPRYDGGKNVESACSFFERFFAECSHRTFNMNLYVYTTTHAVNAENIRDALHDIHYKVFQPRRNIEPQIAPDA